MREHWHMIPIRERIVLVFMLLMIAGLILVRQMLLSTFAIEGKTLRVCQEHIYLLKRENMLLREKLLEKSSYTTLEKEALTAGFVTPAPNQYIYLQKP